MADVLGTVVGVISFGITVCDGLVNYYQAWEARDDDISSALSSAVQLGHVFKLLKIRLGSFLKSSPEAAVQVAGSLRLAEIKLKKLQVILNQCRINEPEGSKERLVDLAKRSAYPFRRNTIKNLQRLIGELTNNLSLLLQIIQLDISTNSEIAIAATADVGSSTMKDVINIKQTVSSIEGIVDNKIMSIAETTSDIRRQYDLLQETVLRIMPAPSPLTMHVATENMARPETHEALDTNQQLASTRESLQIQPTVEDTCASAMEISPTVRHDSIHIDLRPGSISPRCSCRKWKRKRVSEIRRGALRIFNESYESSSHYEFCPYYLCTERSTRIGVDTKMFSVLLSRFVEGSCSITFGAGSFSILPALNLRRVFRPDSPAFKLFRASGSHAAPILKMSPEDARAELHRLFQTRQASPFDVDESGRTLLNALFSSLASDVRSWTIDFLTPYTSLMLDLADAGVPRNEVSNYSISKGNPLDVATRLSLWDYGAERFMRKRKQLVESLITAGFDHSDEFWSGRAAHIGSRRNWTREIQFGQHLEGWIDATENGPLSYAILKRSEQAVKQFLSKNPASLLQERNKLGHNAIHLAAGWPAGLKVLFKAGGTQLVNVPEKTGYIPLMSACAARCIESMTLLIEAGSTLSSPSWTSDYFSEEIIEMIFDSEDRFGLDLIATTIKQRQHAMKAIALEQLPAKVTRALKIPHDTILEGPILSLLVQALNTHNVTIPKELKPSSGYGTVYHNLRFWVGQCEDWESEPQRWFDAGFHLVDEPNFEGLTPLANISPWDIEDSLVALKYACWLLSKGAKLIPPSTPLREAATSAHYLAHNIGWPFRRSSDNGPSISKVLSDLDAESTQLLYDLCFESTCDGCTCTCSAKGCTPLTALLKGMQPRIDVFAVEEILEEKLTWEALEGKECAGQSQSAPSGDARGIAFVTEILHFHTHQRLGLSHLCCDKKSGRPFHQRYDLNMLQQIQESEALLIVKHKNLISEFVSEYQRQGIPLSEFMAGYWEERMDQELSYQEPWDPEKSNESLDQSV